MFCCNTVHLLTYNSLYSPFSLNAPLWFLIQQLLWKITTGLYLCNPYHICSANLLLPQIQRKVTNNLTCTLQRSRLTMPVSRSSSVVTVQQVRFDYLYTRLPCLTALIRSPRKDITTQRLHKRLLHPSLVCQLNPKKNPRPSLLIPLNPHNLSEPTVFENYVHDLYVDDQLVELSLWDTAGPFSPFNSAYINPAV